MNVDPGELPVSSAPTRRRGQLPITVLVQTKNEAVGIRQCLSSLSDFDEVIVVDSRSEDGTRDIAVSAGATVIDFTWNGEYPKKKQWQLDHVETRNEWLLFLDADETPTPRLVAELRSIDLGRHAAFDIDLDYVFSGRRLRYGHRVRKRALVRRGAVRYPVVDDLDLPGMGELEGHYQPVALGPVGRLHGRLKHHDLDPVRTWFDRHNRYSDWEAGLRTRGASSAVNASRTRQGRLFSRMPLKPLLFFLYSYIARLGILDGRAGFDYAFAHSAYYWQIGLKERELRERVPRE